MVPHGKWAWEDTSKESKGALVLTGRETRKRERSRGCTGPASNGSAPPPALGVPALLGEAGYQFTSHKRAWIPPTSLRFTHQPLSKFGQALLISVPCACSHPTSFSVPVWGSHHSALATAVRWSPGLLLVCSLCYAHCCTIAACSAPQTPVWVSRLSVFTPLVRRINERGLSWCSLYLTQAPAITATSHIHILSVSLKVLLILRWCCELQFCSQAFACAVLSGGSFSPPDLHAVQGQLIDHLLHGASPDHPDPRGPSLCTLEALCLCLSRGAYLPNFC